MTIPDPTKAAIQQRIDRIHWYHEFDFGDGLRAEARTPDAQSHRALWRFIESELDKIDFAGKTVLDIGCWDGFWSFYAERRGAARVLATDDASQNWAGVGGFELARELLRSSVEYDLKTSVYELGNLRRRFDIILCLGVYYHLLDPFYAFAQIRHCCNEDAVVVFEGDAFFGLVDSQVQSAALYSRDIKQAPRFVPDPSTLRFLVNSAYFTITHEAIHPLQTPTVEGTLPPGVNRMLLVCRSLRDRNEYHEYRPPFGLHQYDARSSRRPEHWSTLYVGDMDARTYYSDDTETPTRGSG